MESVRPDAKSIITRTLISSGFRWMGGAQKCYEGNISVNGHEFGLQISDIDPYFMRLPTVKLLQIPEGLGNLPHLMSDKKLCYLDPEGVYLDPHEPDNNTRIVLEAVTQLLKTYISGDLSAEFDDEFWFYWNRDYYCSVLSESNEGIGAFYEVSTLSGETRTEHVIAGSFGALEDWFTRRGATNPSAQHPVCFLRLEGEPRVANNPDFPPTSWSAFLRWIHQYHPQDERHLIRKLVPILQKAECVTIMLRSPQGVLIGVTVRFMPEIKSLLMPYRTNTRRRSKRERFTSPEKIRSILLSSKLVLDYYRLQGLDVTEKFVLERNLDTPSFKGKKIALLGCGTVGGFTAQLLSMAGAGAGTGNFTLFDSDIVTSSNVGRHLVGLPYLFERKSDAVKHYIEQHSNVPIRVEAYPELKAQGIELLRQYDLVIDATGNEVFSTLLAHSFADWRQSREETLKVPILIHSWIDGNGRAVRALLDDGRGACYRCLRESDNKGGLVDQFPVFKNGVDKNVYQKSHNCGESYIEFSAGLSSQAAGMVQQLALEALYDNPKPRFRHASYSSDIRSTKSQNVKRTSNCPSCSP